jgi:CRP-like cAMP-binding protein
MTAQPLSFSVDSEKLLKLGAHYLHSSEGSAALKAGHLSSDERLFLSILRTPLLNETLFVKNRKIIEVGQKFEDAYFVVQGEVQIQRGNKIHMLGAGSVLGLAEGMVGLASSYSALASTSVQVKIISFHKVNQIVKVLPTELRLIMATIIKRNLTAI